MSIKFPLLTSEDIEVKVKQVTKTGALLLLYKTARTDARILDETVGPMNWECAYQEIKGNLYCGIGIREKEDQAFVWKWDCGIESGQDDGQEKKAEASDAFKRSASRLGIGRELYTSPKIWASVATVQKGDKWYLQDPYAQYVVTNIEYNESTKVITKLEIKNAQSGIVVYDFSLDTNGALGEKYVKTASQNQKQEEKQTKKTKTQAKTEENPGKTESSLTLAQLISNIGEIVKKMYKKYKEDGLAKYSAITKELSGIDDFKCNSATEEQYPIVLAIYTKLVEEGYND